MNKLKGKKLFIIGATAEECDIVRYAKAAGVYTIVADYLADSPAKKIADNIAINGEITVTIFGLIFNRLAKGSKNFVRYGRKLLSIILLY